MKLVVATTSTHKLGEIRDLLRDVPTLEVLSLRDFETMKEPEETGATMRENARIKAQAYARELTAPTLADDSGLEVEALDGAPGVYSARWVEGSDADRTTALLERLKDVPDEKRIARYRCALCFEFNQSTLIELEAICEGRIARQPRGENGFGYDPIFEITENTGNGREWIGKTIAEAPPEIKASVSHRARAVRMLAEKLRDLSL